MLQKSWYNVNNASFHNICFICTLYIICIVYNHSILTLRIKCNPFVICQSLSWPEPFFPVSLTLSLFLWFTHIELLALPANAHFFWVIIEKAILASHCRILIYSLRQMEDFSVMPCLSSMPSLKTIDPFLFLCICVFLFLFMFFITAIRCLFSFL